MTENRPDPFSCDLDELGAAAEFCAAKLAEVGVAIKDEVAAVDLLRQVYEELWEGMDTEMKPIPKGCHCRVCGRRYDFKGEAKACERDHRQRRFK